MPIAVNLDALMAKKNMSVRELSEVLDIPEDKIPILMSGQVRALRFVTLEKLCRVLDCHPGELLEPVTEEEFQKRHGMKSPVFGPLTTKYKAADTIVVDKVEVVDKVVVVNKNDVIEKKDLVDKIRSFWKKHTESNKRSS